MNEIAHTCRTTPRRFTQVDGFIACKPFREHSRVRFMYAGGACLVGHDLELSVYNSTLEHGGSTASRDATIVT